MAKKDKWLIPTNTDNLRMIIAQGLMSSPSGFSKYYTDILELFNGYIPLFKNRIQPDILDNAISEVDGLIPCIIEIDLKTVTGMIKGIKGNDIIDINSNDIGVEDIDILLLLAPLPILCISKIIFKSKNDIKDFKEDSQLYSNVILGDLIFSSTLDDQKLFKKDKLPDYSISDLKKITTLEIKEVDYNKIYSFGGLLANLFYFSKNGNISNDIYKSFYNFDKDITNKNILPIYNYFDNIDEQVAENDIKTKMYNGLIDIAINCKDFKENIIEFLESNLWDETTKSRTQSISDRLKLFELNIDKTVSEQFEETKTLLEKTLLMLFLREDSEALMDYNLDIFTQEDYISFAMMFGIRDKFIKTPKFLREYNNVQNFITLKMAEYAHITIGSNIQFKHSITPLTVMSMLNQNSFKKKLAKELKIESSINTIMPNKDYIHNKGKNIYTGFIEPEYEILEDKYFQLISKKKITELEYNKFTKLK
ncbi:MAG: hypothetical protein KAQ94_10080 [Arcobacteraceae bacterium]|nr:hypothetical protein [Arcobacteraceae bacterium]